jgi:hypothetical protein
MATQVNSVQPSRLPNRFPRGTRFVIEGRGGRINLQYLEFPDGRHIDLSTKPGKRPPLRRARRTAAAGRKSAGRKI